MKEVQQVTLIQTAIATRGDGEATPIRRITQWWTQAGDLVAEHDPCSVILTDEKRLKLVSIIGSLGLSAQEFAAAIERVSRVLGRHNAKDQATLTRPAANTQPTE